MEVMTYTKKATLERLERQSANETLEKLVALEPSAREIELKLEQLTAAPNFSII